MESEVVGNRADQKGMERVVLYVVDDCGVVGICSSGVEGFVVAAKLGDIPLKSASEMTPTQG